MADEIEDGQEELRADANAAATAPEGDNWDFDPEIDHEEDQLHKISMAAGIERMMTNESGIRGSIIEKTHDFLKAEMQPTIMRLQEPKTDVEALGIVTRNGLDIISPGRFDDHRLFPRRRAGTAVLSDLPSFNNHVNRFKDADSAVFACNDRSKPSLTGVLNYHRAGATSDPRFGDHRALFNFPLSDEWQAWTAFNGKELPMIGFARFLEDHIVDVTPLSNISLGEQATNFAQILGGREKIADAATLMSMALNMQVFEKSNTANANNLATGEIRADFETIYNDSNGAKLNVPSMFVISIPVFKGEPPSQILARLRFRKAGAKIIFFYELWRTDIVFDESFDQALNKVAMETGVPIYLGADEGDCSPKRAATEAHPF